MVRYPFRYKVALRVFRKLPLQSLYQIYPICARKTFPTGKNLHEINFVGAVQGVFHADKVLF